MATLLATNGVTAPSVPQNYGALTPGGAALNQSFTFMATGTCGGTILPTMQLQDGSRNLGTVLFNLALGAQLTSFTENFDGVAAPELPSGWTSSPEGAWATTTAQSDTLPNSVFAPDLPSEADYQLVSPIIPISRNGAQLVFHHSYDTEPGYDGGVLEISVQGGAFTDILTAGGAFLSGAYNGTIDSSFSNPLAGRSAWTGDSAGFTTTKVALPEAAAGGTIQLRWRLGSDSSVSATGWYVDTIAVAEGYACCTGAPQPDLSAPRYNSTNHTFRFDVTGGTGYSYAVLASTNLSNWVTLSTNTSPFTLIDTNAASFPRRFYRTRYP